MAYILVVNPQMLADPFYIMEQPEYAAQVANGVFFCHMSDRVFWHRFLMSVYAKIPFAQAPGMGLNAFLRIRLCSVWDTPMGRRLRSFLSPEFCLS